MSKRSTMASIGDFFAVWGSAVAVSRAMESRKAPRVADLNRLGIDPAKFGRIAKF